MAETDTTELPVVEQVELKKNHVGEEPVTVSELQRLIAKTGANPAEIEWPQDRWGFTSQIKKTVLQAASTVRGQQDKHDLLVATMAVLLTHIKKRLPADQKTKAEYEATLEKFAEQRAFKDRVSGDPVAKPGSENLGLLD